MVMTTVLKGNVLGFGAPVDKQRTDFDALATFSPSTKGRE